MQNPASCNLLSLRNARTLSIALLAMFSAGVAPPVSANNADKVLNAVTRTMLTRCYNKNAALQLSDQLAAKRQDLLSSTDAETLKRKINAELATLGMSHCSLLGQDDERYWFLTSLFAKARGGSPQPIDWTGMSFDDTGRVSYVLDDGPAAHAGLIAGDVLEKVDQSAFRGQSNFLNTSGTGVALTVRRNGARLSLTISPTKQNPFDAYLAANQASVQQFQI